VLLAEFLQPLGITQFALAGHIGVPVQRVNEIIRARRGVSPETAWLLGQALGTTPEFWVNLQAAHDLATKRPARCVGRLRRTA
jgi:addiction module HigA family antidote